MDKVIFPKAIPEVKMLKDTLIKDLPSECKVKILPLNRKRIQIRRGFGIISELQVGRDKITVFNSVPNFFILSLLFCFPLAIYFHLKKKDGENLHSAVHDIVLRATQV